MAAVNYNPYTDIPDLSGKVILITGGTSGVGKETIQYLFSHSPSHILFTGRNTSAASTIISESKVSHPAVSLTFIPLDLSDLSSVRTASNQILSSLDRLDTVLCIAGTMCDPPSLSPNGYEIQFATNHLSHALLLKLLLPLLLKTTQCQPSSDVRIILTTSQAARPPLPPPGGIVFESLKTSQGDWWFGSWRRYAQSKLANILYARELAKRYPQISVVSVHPGIAYTPLLRHLSWVDWVVLRLTTFWKVQAQEELAWNGLWAAFAVGREEVVQGAYYEPVGQLVEFEKVGRGGAVDWREDDKLAGELWNWTEEQLGKWMDES